MADIVNLRRFRKQAKRQNAEHAAAANRRTHGLSKAERALAEARLDQAAHHLDQHRIDNGDDR